MAQQINLFDPALQRQRDWLALSNVVLGAVLLMAIVGAAGSAARSDLPALTAQVASHEVQLKALRDQMTVLGQQMANRKTDPRIEQDLAAAKLLLSARGDVLKILQQRLGPDAVSYAEYLRGFARQSLPGLWLTGFAFNANDGGMEIEGRISDPALLPEYIRRLNREQAFQGRAFAALKLAEGKVEPLPANATAAPVATAMPVVARKAAFHEFKLIPLKPAGAIEGGKSSALTQLETGKIAGGQG